MKPASLTLALLLALGPISAVHAADLPGSRFSFGAFGTLAADYQNSRGLAFRRDLGQGHGARAGQIDLGTDSLLGLQATGRITAGFDAQVQVSVHRNEDGFWRPELERAFLRYRPNQTVMMRAGRIGLGLYLLADAFDVGYAYLTIRPPVEVYGMLPADEFDGADVTFSRTLGGGVGQIRLLAGKWPFEIALANGTAMAFDNAAAVAVTADYLHGNWQTRAGLLQIHISASADPVAPALAATGFPQAVQLAGELSRSSRTSDGIEAGTLYDGNPLEAAVVLVHLNSDYLQGPKFNSGFVLLGYHIGQLTPYGFFSMIDDFGGTRAAGLPPLPAFEPLIAAAQADETAALATQRDLALGVRYDFAPHLDVKAQIDRIWLQQSALVFDYNTPVPGHTSLTVLGLALDFAF